jgi:hypothetical protein
MAKISARGATEIARLKVQRKGQDFQMLYVLCSDGRVLARITGANGNSFHVRGNVRDEKNRTAEFLAIIVKRDGLEVVS